MADEKWKAKGGDDQDAVPAADKWENRVGWVMPPDGSEPLVRVAPEDPGNHDGYWYIPHRTMPVVEGYCPNCGQPAERDWHAPGCLDDDGNIMPVNPELCRQA